MVSVERLQPQALSFGVAAWAAWLPGREAMVSGGSAVVGEALPASLRRRVTPIGRKAMEAAWALLAKRSDDPVIVLASRHGEYSRTFGLLASLAETGEVSPAEFSLSVHHGLAGLLSIATGNRSAHTALAAGGDSFGYGCLEAASCLADGADSVLLTYFDEDLPAIYAPISDGAGTGGAVAALMVPNAAETISVAIAPTSQPGGDDLAGRFCDLLMGNAPDANGVGERMEWRWRRVA